MVVLGVMLARVRWGVGGVLVGGAFWVVALGVWLMMMPGGGSWTGRLRRRGGMGGQVLFCLLVSPSGRIQLYSALWIRAPLLEMADRASASGRDPVLLFQRERLPGTLGWQPTMDCRLQTGALFCFGGSMIPL